MEHHQNYCPNCKGYYLINQSSGEIYRLGCNRYDCDYCGKIKVWKFKKALNKYLSSFKFIRMFTYTVRTTAFHNNIHWNRMSSEVWRRFINNIRRNKQLTERQRNFRYVKVLEFTQRGYVHFHVIQTEYLPFDVVYRAWNEALSVMLEMNLTWSDNKIINRDSLGGVNIIGIANGKHAANYVTKYLIKSCKLITEKSKQLIGEERSRVRIYTKSNKVAFFPKKHKVNAWLFVSAGYKSKMETLYLYLLAVTSPKLVEMWQEKNEFLE